MLGMIRAIQYTLRDSSAIPFLLRTIRFLPPPLMELVSMAELGRLYAGVLHDLSSPLTALLMHVELFVHTDQRDVLLGVSAHIKHLLKLARGTQYSSGYGSISIQETIEHARGLLTHRAMQANVRIITYVAQDVYVYGNKLALQQILNNLIGNAIEAYEHIEQRQKTVTVTATRTARWITITVHDTGCGIAQKNLRKIFLPFYTTKTHGTGLGLTLVTQLVTVSFRGRITATSTPQAGTYMTVQIPIPKNFRQFAHS